MGGKIRNGDGIINEYTKSGTRKRESPEPEYDKEEIDICLNCTREKCRGICHRITKYRKEKNSK